MRSAYLTIDDSPSPHTVALTDFLAERGVPAIYFCRGDSILEFGMEALIHAAERGIVLGNHAFHHYRASQQPFEVYTEEIRATEDLIDQVYHEARVERGARYFRFPHIDRGTGGWLIDYDRLNPEDRVDVIAMFSDGLNISLDPPSAEQIETKARLQAFLKAEGFSQFPAAGITFPWYQGEMAAAYDVLYTYSTSDWMLLGRHKGKWPYKSAEDLKAKIDDDKWLQDETSQHIILAHDKDEIEILTRDLVDHCLEQDIEFLPIP